MEIGIGFSARGTKGGNVGIRYDDGRDVSVTGATLNNVDMLVANAYRAKYPLGEEQVRGTVTVTAEME